MPSPSELKHIEKAHAKYLESVAAPAAPAAPIAQLPPHKRPVRTYYYASVTDKVSDYALRSRASTLHNAIIAALRHILAKQYRMADFYNEDGMRIGYVKRTGPRKIEVFHTDFLLH